MEILLTTVITLSVLSAILGILVALNAKYIMLGLHLALVKMKSKNNVGVITFHGKDKNLQLPVFVNLKLDEYKTKKGRVLLTREMFKSELKYWGMSWCILDDDDNINIPGLFYSKNIYQEVDGEMRIVDQEKVMVKDAEVLHFDQIESQIRTKAFLGALSSFMNTNQWILYASIGACIVGAIAVLMLWGLVDSEIPLIIGKLDAIIGVLSQ